MRSLVIKLRCIPVVSFFGEFPDTLRFKVTVVFDFREMLSVLDLSGGPLARG